MSAMKRRKKVRCGRIGEKDQDQDQEQEQEQEQKHEQEQDEYGERDTSC